MARPRRTDAVLVTLAQVVADEALGLTTPTPQAGAANALVSWASQWASRRAAFSRA